MIEGAPVTRLKTTPRSDLRQTCGVNTHFCFSPSVYSKNGEPNANVLKPLIDLQVGFIRERYWPNNPAQQKAFAALAKAGIGLYLFMCDVGTTTKEAAANVAALAATPYASSVVAICGPNEPNAHGGTSWPGKCVDLQEAIYNEAIKYRSLRNAAIVGPVLMHNVRDIDGDYQALGAAGIQRWCDTGDFHYYPGAAGPIGNAREAVRAGQAYGSLPLFQSETGWTGADTDPDTAARFSVEAYLRNHLTGMVGTILYELADESQYVNGREGLFGLRKPDDTKPAYDAIFDLLSRADGGEDFVGTLANYSRGVESDTNAVVTSEGRGRFTVYLLKASQTTATLVLPAEYAADSGTLSIDADGTRRYTVSLRETMTTVQVRLRANFAE
jgi:hypothetical protein